MVNLQKRVLAWDSAVNYLKTTPMWFVEPNSFAQSNNMVVHRDAKSVFTVPP